MYLSDVADDAIFYNKYQDSYSFIVDLHGYTIWHPSFPRPRSVRTTQYPTDIRHFEQIAGFDLVRSRLLTELAGKATLPGGDNNHKTYAWHRAAHFYVICVATTVSNATKLPVHLNHVGVHLYQADDIVSIAGNLVPELVYHHLVPIAVVPLCRHFKQLATMESITLFLSASSFISPFLYLKSNREASDETKTNNAKSVMAYIKDATNLLANPGLLPQIRNDVTALFHIMSYLKRRHLDDDDDVYRNYIIRRYAATMNGVIEIYPGCLLSYDLEPLRRPWFVKAIQNPGKIVMTEPYLDAAGAGYIVTLAHTLYEGKSNALHSIDRDIPVAIVGIDVTLGFLYKLLLSGAAYCADAHVKCFLMEDRGFLLAHPSQLEPAAAQGKHRRPLEHVTHKESYMANDILYHRQLVEKKLCTNFQNRTRQRYYQFNTSLSEVLTNRVHGERTKYQITAVPGTNLFVALLNSTCDGGAFCPCSTVDRICLNCHRMEQTNCECPCECPLVLMEDDDDDGGGHQWRAIDDEHRQPTDVCEVSPEQLIAFLGQDAIDMDVELQACVNINCEVYGTQNECLGE